MSRSKSRRPSRQNTGKAATKVSAAARAEAAAPEKPVSASNGARTATKVSAAARAEAAAPEKPVSASNGARTTTATRPTQSGGKAQSRDAAKYERRMSEREHRYQAERRRRNTRIAIISTIVAVVVIGAGLTGFLIYHARTSTPTANSAAPYQETVFDNNYPPVDNVYCDQLEQSVEHIHAHLTIWINGTSGTAPSQVGIPVTSSSSSTTSSSVDCYYWLHVHDTSGVIHIESPSLEPFTLGQFLDEWNQEFNSLGFPSQLLLNTGWTIWLNGQPYKGSLDSVPLTAHALITVAYNSPKAKPDTTYNWGSL